MVGFNTGFPMDINGPQLEAMTPVQKARNCRAEQQQRWMCGCADVRMCGQRTRLCARGSLASQVLGKFFSDPVLRMTG
jgi:hypothetical protein